jgi:hypothetical protein
MSPQVSGSETGKNTANTLLWQTESHRNIDEVPTVCAVLAHVRSQRERKLKEILGQLGASGLKFESLWIVQAPPSI